MQVGFVSRLSAGHEYPVCVDEVVAPRKPAQHVGPAHDTLGRVRSRWAGLGRVGHGPL